MTKAATTSNISPAGQNDDLISLLHVIKGQIEAAMHAIDAPAATLVETTHAMGQATETVARCIFDFSGSPARVFKDLMTLHDDLHARSSKAATAIQFHDRLVQCLTHVCGSLSSLSEFLSSGQGPKSPAEWKMLKERIRGMQSMEQERALFDLLSGDAPEAGKAAAAEKQPGKGGGGGNVELF